MRLRIFCSYWVCWPLGVLTWTVLRPSSGIYSFDNVLLVVGTLLMLMAFMVGVNLHLRCVWCSLTWFNALLVLPMGLVRKAIVSATFTGPLQVQTTITTWSTFVSFVVSTSKSPGFSSISPFLILAFCYKGLKSHFATCRTNTTWFDHFLFSTYCILTQ